MTKLITLKVLNFVFSNLKNSRVLCTYEETWKRPNSKRFITINNSTFSDNTGNPQLNMINIVLEELYFISKVNYTILIDGCTFTRNTNMKALIYVRLLSTDRSIVYMQIISSTFSNNKNITFIKVGRKSQSVCHESFLVSLSFVNVSSNEHHYGDNLISITNGHLHITFVCFNQNGYRL